MVQTPHLLPTSWASSSHKELKEGRCHQHPELVGPAGPAPSPVASLHPPTLSPWQPDPTIHEHYVLWPQALVLCPSSYPHHRLPLNLQVSAEKSLSGNFPRLWTLLGSCVSVPPQTPIFSPLLVQITTSCDCLCTHGLLEKRKPLSLISLFPLPGRVPGTWSPQ